MKGIVLFVLKFYQKYISKFTPSSCRYYPTCSEYAIWQFKYNNFFLAFFATFLRILRCNQFFKGGIDYPIVYRKKPKFIYSKTNKNNINFWFVPHSVGKFYVIKAIVSKEK
ncbi:MULTISPECIES: membrane protein insertion efficiency factor YidD [unclassified Campylobacter]|uniref:membrane protein insertion efficiency factor YidD n=1 Tax=unclassified Campylobacter TaxID=2593542 RepID=UPI003D3442CF